MNATAAERSCRRSILGHRCLTVTVLVLAGLGSAVASAAARPASLAMERLAITPPAHARVSTPQHRRLYTIIVRGFSAQPAWLLVFVDYELCSPALAAERMHGASSVSSRISGEFRRRSVWESGVAATDHVCAYLVAPASDHVLARRSASFPIH